METTFVWTGIAVGGVLLIPLLLEFFKRNLPVLFGLIMFLLTLYWLSPHSPQIRAVWEPISKVPAGVATEVTGLVHR